LSIGLGPQQYRWAFVENLAPGLIVEMQMHAAAIELLERFEKCHVGARSAGVVQAPGTVAPGKLLDHAPDRRDADAAGKQSHVLGVLDQRKIVAWCADRYLIAYLHFVDDVTRAAAAVLVALDADDVALGIAIGHHQGELPNQPVGQVQVDVRARLVGRQRAAVGPAQGVELCLSRNGRNLGNARRDQARGCCRCGRACR
jgi:hypothetical protein